MARRREGSLTLRNATVVLHAPALPSPPGPLTLDRLPPSTLPRRPPKLPKLALLGTLWGSSCRSTIGLMPSGDSPSSTLDRR